MPLELYRALWRLGGRVLLLFLAVEVPWLRRQGGGGVGTKPWVPTLSINTSMDEIFFLVSSHGKTSCYRGFQYMKGPSTQSCDILNQNQNGPMLWSLQFMTGWQERLSWVNGGQFSKDIKYQGKEFGLYILYTSGELLRAWGQVRDKNQWCSCKNK